MKCDMASNVGRQSTEACRGATEVGRVSPPPGVAEGGCVMLARETSHYALTPLTEH